MPPALGAGYTHILLLTFSPLKRVSHVPFKTTLSYTAIS
jgi:hypothetical protein